MEAEKKAFKITKREIGFVLGIVVFLLVKFLPLAELSSTVELTVGGQTCLALTLATVVFWRVAWHSRALWACSIARCSFCSRCAWTTRVPRASRDGRLHV